MENKQRFRRGEIVTDRKTYFVVLTFDEEIDGSFWLYCVEIGTWKGIPIKSDKVSKEIPAKKKSELKERFFMAVYSNICIDPLGYLRTR